MKTTLMKSVLTLGIAFFSDYMTRTKMFIPFLL